jgi:hypothetical protein
MGQTRAWLMQMIAAKLLLSAHRKRDSLDLGIAHKECDSILHKFSVVYNRTVGKLFFLCCHGF